MLEINDEVLKAAGMKATKQRAIIMDIIRSGHLDADGIYHMARQKNVRLSLSTVYRNLHKFKQLGIVEELHFDESHHHYEVKPSAEHHHLICLGCGKVIEFRYPLSRYIKKNIDEARDFDIAVTEIRVTGYCAECRRRQK